MSLYLTQPLPNKRCQIGPFVIYRAHLTPPLTSHSQADVWCNSPQFLRESTQNSAQTDHQTVRKTMSGADEGLAARVAAGAELWHGSGTSQRENFRSGSP